MISDLWTKSKEHKQGISQLRYRWLRKSQAKCMKEDTQLAVIELAFALSIVVFNYTEGEEERNRLEEPVPINPLMLTTSPILESRGHTREEIEDAIVKLQCKDVLLWDRKKKGVLYLADFTFKRIAAVLTC
jgi:hypothetical protein